MNWFKSLSLVPLLYFTFSQSLPNHQVNESFASSIHHDHRFKDDSTPFHINELFHEQQSLLLNASFPGLSSGLQVDEKSTSIRTIQRDHLIHSMNEHSQKKPMKTGPLQHNSNDQQYLYNEHLKDRYEFQTILGRWEKFLLTDFERKFHLLPLTGQSNKIPWSGYLFRTISDSINSKGGLYFNKGNKKKIDEAYLQRIPPSEKYAAAFNLSAKFVSKKVSEWSGIDSIHHRPKCISSRQCKKSLFDAVKCVFPSDKWKKVGQCTPKWWTLSHAWAAASILESEPQCDVEYNKVKFEIYDIHALLTQMYDRSSIHTLFAGERCDETRVSKDNFGRYQNRKCRDLNPAIFHLLTTNVVGKLNRSFIIDIEATEKVWNRPIQSYEIHKMDKISIETANNLTSLYHYSPRNINIWDYNNKAKSLMYVEMKLKYVHERPEKYSGMYLLHPSYTNKTHFSVDKKYQYILELDEQDRIVGGEWIGANKMDHPDFAWLPLSRPASNFSIGGITYQNVQELLLKSVLCH